MLKLLQEGVNEHTQRLEKKDPSTLRTKQTEALAVKQARVEDLTRKLARKIQKEDDPDGTDK
ncbi:MAG: hypothetical protein KDC95_01960 [Planctomycetes bacterium]|nr:hypothetical protein [Planctomycetota bacterium]